MKTVRVPKGGRPRYSAPTDSTEPETDAEDAAMRPNVAPTPAVAGVVIGAKARREAGLVPTVVLLAERASIRASLDDRYGESAGLSGGGGGGGSSVSSAPGRRSKKWKR